MVFHITLVPSWDKLPLCQASVHVVGACRATFLDRFYTIVNRS
jgi:hypothetical protein